MYNVHSNMYFTKFQAVPGGGPGGLAEVRRAAVVPHVRWRLLQRHHAYHTW